VKIEDLRINQMVRVVATEYPEWHNGTFRIVGLFLPSNGEERITLDDGSPSGAEWRLSELIEV